MILQRKSVRVTENFGSCTLCIVWEDINNPLLDSDGNVIYTNELDESGSQIPEYPEYAISKHIPNGIEIGPTTMEELIQSALEDAKLEAARRLEAKRLKEELEVYVDDNNVKQIDYVADSE